MNHPSMPQILSLQFVTSISLVCVFRFLHKVANTKHFRYTQSVASCRIASIARSIDECLTFFLLFCCCFLCVLAYRSNGGRFILWRNHSQRLIAYSNISSENKNVVIWFTLFLTILFDSFFFSLWQHSYLSVASFCQDEAVNFCMCKHMRNSRIQTKNNNKQTTKTQERKKIRRKPQKIADCMSIRTSSCLEYEYNANNNDCDVDEKK